MSITLKTSLMQFNEEYYCNALDNNQKIDYLFIGKDPYPTNATSIAFHKNNLRELKRKAKSKRRKGWLISTPPRPA